MRVGRSTIAGQALLAGIALVAIGCGFAVGRFWPVEEMGGAPPPEQSAEAAQPVPQADAFEPATGANGNSMAEVTLADFVGIADRLVRGSQLSLRELSVIHAEIEAGQLVQWVREFQERLPPAHSEAIMPMLMDKLAEQDPQQAWEIALDLEDSAHFWRIATEWAAKDPYELLRHFQALPEGKIRDSAQPSVFQALADHEPDLVWKELGWDGNGSWKTSILKKVIGKIAQENLPHAQMLVDGASSQSARNSLQQAIAGSLAKKDMDAALAYCETIENPLTRWKAQMTALQDAPLDPAAKARKLEELNLTHSAESSVFSSIMRSWLEKDPEAAMAWCQTLPKNTQIPLKRLWLAQEFQRDWRKGLALIVKEHKHAQSSRYTSVVSQNWAQLTEGEQREALSYLETDLPWEEAAPYLESILENWAVDRGPEALAYARRLREEHGDEADHLVDSVLFSLSRRDPAVAAEHLDLSWEKNREHLVRHLAQTWGSRDPQAAVDWLQTLEPGKVKDEALEGFASSIEYYDHAGATEWAGEIQDPERRRNAQRYLFRTWHKRFPSLAEAWLQASDVPAEWHREFLEEED